MGTGPSFEILHKLHPLKILSFMMKTSRPALSSMRTSLQLKQSIIQEEFSSSVKAYVKKIGKIGAKDASAQNYR